MFARIGYVLTGLAAVLLFCGADPADRRDLATKDAIRGHWLTKSQRTHYYIGDGKVIMVDEGENKPMTYKILDSNEQEGWVKINVQTAQGGGHEKLLRLTTDKTGIFETIEFKLETRTFYISTIWNYVDDKTAPKDGGGKDPLKN